MLRAKDVLTGQLTLEDIKQAALLSLKTCFGCSTELHSSVPFLSVELVFKQNTRLDTVRLWTYSPRLLPYLTKYTVCGGAKG